MVRKFDFLAIGSGIAGMSFALPVTGLVTVQPWKKLCAKLHRRFKN